MLFKLLHDLFFLFRTLIVTPACVSISPFSTILALHPPLCSAVRSLPAVAAASGQVSTSMRVLVLNVFYSWQGALGRGVRWEDIRINTAAVSVFSIYTLSKLSCIIYILYYDYLVDIGS